jgi:hypothetical protein
MIALKWGAQLVGHISKEVAFGEVGCLGFQHRLMRNRGVPFSLLFRLQEGEAGVAVFRQGSRVGNSSSLAASYRLPGEPPLRRDMPT